ncbi:hypothetical protein ACOSP6_11090 [Tenacibaculum sp. MEBiC06402]|uniref:hypothetical protein n=1 Tax=Tenacibaculum sp. MEBiC07804 TaxID=3412025 RepID=UPI003B994C24
MLSDAFHQKGWSLSKILDFSPVTYKKIDFHKGNLSLNHTSLLFAVEALKTWLKDFSVMHEFNQSTEIVIFTIRLNADSEINSTVNDLKKIEIKKIHDLLISSSPFDFQIPFAVILFNSDEEFNQFEVTNLGELKVLKEEEKIARNFKEIMKLHSKANEERVIVNNSIEFPEELYLAGLGILNYFGTYIQQKYPKEKIKVKIEQENYLVRLIIEGEEGAREVVEKALQEYQLIVTGERNPEQLTDDPKIILGLKSELRIAKVRIENQRDIIAIKDQSINALNEFLLAALNNKSEVNIDFKPSILLANNNVLLPVVNNFIEELRNAKETLNLDSSEYIEFEEISSELELINNIETLKKSGRLKNFKAILEKHLKRIRNAGKVLESTNKNIETIQKLAGKYNKIAELCGLPTVPSFLTK